MIQPDAIRQKAENIYPEFLRAWLVGEDGYFPRLIPSQREPTDDVATAIQQVRRLRESSKEALGYGYTVEWREIRSRKFGRNLFPQRIVFATREDFLRFIRKEQEFASFILAVEQIRANFPQLERWIHANSRLLVDIAGELDGLLEVTKYVCLNPRPDRFARELPLRVDTKFIGRNQRVLRSWLDIVLPPHTIRADEEHFERRFGFRYIEPHLFLRFLDATWQRELHIPCDVLSVPLSTLATWSVREGVVVIVENRVNLMTIPCAPRSLVMGGLGNGVALLRFLPWLSDNRLLYWGDLDTEGFQILSQLRAAFPHAKSIMMNDHTLTRFRSLAVERSSPGIVSTPPPHLAEEELGAFTLCANENLRLEQERIPQSEVVRVISSQFLLC